LKAEKGKYPQEKPTDHLTERERSKREMKGVFLNKSSSKKRKNHRGRIPIPKQSEVGSAFGTLIQLKQKEKEKDTSLWEVKRQKTKARKT